MPEGPTIVLLKEETKQFIGKKVIAVSGTSKIDQTRVLHEKIKDIKSWGKHFLICFNGFTIRIHFLMFGSYRINERKESTPRLHLTLKNGEMNFYTCAVKCIEGDIDQQYDWSSDVMNEQWNAGNAKKKLKKLPDKLICDLLLEQEIFSGVGNIIKNEVLYRVRVHPESALKKIPAAKITQLIKESQNYSFQFLEWKRKAELKRHWLAHTKKKCVQCNGPIVKKYTGVKKRRSFFCPECQRLYK